ncbi:LPXTG cell wall anchor domain-containing protein [Companilactobacillus kimchiensis]|uniref:Gram-positive cocci surface proteins LPxTG domain-containing protein n=1 Tax=Companilactobacillus kimchiensis TaxID=993692 RepID=A0A0R2LEU8_9LACO|nr:LPXTG cell wall anchor domain-containing protein [Companilactobacillus kimchiensis]KRO00081.1 hypothetical protein IV57_GL002097 [Companilactobacillus kimchiensis]
MMKKFLISLLSVGMLLGIFGEVSYHTGSPNVMEETVQADTTNNSQTINYEVLKRNSNGLSTEISPLFTKSATIYPNNDGTYRVVMTARISDLTSLDVQTDGGQAMKVTKIDNDAHHLNVSFNINSLDDLDSEIPAIVQTSTLGISGFEHHVDFSFDKDSLLHQGPVSTFADSLNQITSAENDLNTTANNVKNLAGNVKSAADSAKDILSTPKSDTTTSTTTNSSNDTDPKTVLKELTYKIAKNNGDGSLISPYFTNTAKVMQNPDGTYYVEMTIKYPKKFGNNAFELNLINNQKPYNLSFRSDGDSNYITFDFPINKITDLSKSIPGNITMNIPDFGLNKNLGFNLNFDSLNPSDLSSLMNSSDTSGLLSDLSSLSNLGDVKPATSTTDTEKNKGTLPQTGNQANDILIVIGGVILVMVLTLLKGTYLKD